MKKGFTLVEISIVLVLIALIIVGVLAGQNLIANSERQLVIKEFQKYNAGIASFKQQYDGLPGDIDNWVSYFPTSTASNGDGNGFISVYNTECLRALYMLKEAGIIDNIKVDTNWTRLLPSEYKKARYFLCSTKSDLDVFYTYATADYALYEKKGNYLSLVSISSTSSEASGPLDSETAKYIDTKLDDGKASSGNVVAVRGFGTGAYLSAGCITGTGGGFTSATEGSVSYDLSSKVNSCRLIYWLHHLD